MAGLSLPIYPPSSWGVPESIFLPRGRSLGDPLPSGEDNCLGPISSLRYALLPCWATPSPTRTSLARKHSQGLWALGSIYHMRWERMKIVPKPNGLCTVLCDQHCSQRTQSYLVPVLVEADQEPWIEQRLGRCRNPYPWV